MADDSPDTDPELERLTWNPQVKEGLAENLQGKKITILVVGFAGVGKSTFINSLAQKRLCPIGTSLTSVTNEIKHVPVVVELGAGRDRTCSLTIIDSPGITGRRKVDDSTKTKLEQLLRSNTFDLLLCCFDLSTNASRFPYLQHSATFGFLKDILGEECIEQKGVIILTKGNEVKLKAIPDHTQTVHQENPSTSSSQALTTRPVALPCSEMEVDGKASNRLPVSVEQLLQEWKQTNQSWLEEEGYGKLANLPVYVAGQVTFTEDGKPDEITEIDGTSMWYEKVWNGCANRYDSDLGTFLLYNYEESKEKAPGFKGPRVYKTTLKKIVARVLAGTAAVAGTGLCIGAGIATAPLAVGLLAAGGAAFVLGGAVYGIIELHHYIKEKRSKASQPTASRTECTDRTKKLN